MAAIKSIYEWVKMCRQKLLTTFILFMIAFALLPSKAAAGCMPYLGTINYNFGQVAVSPSLKVGDTIAQIRPVGIGSSIYCRGDTATFGGLKGPLFPTKSAVIPTDSSLSHYQNQLYETNIRGVGILVAYLYGLRSLYWPSGFQTFADTSSYSVYLIKTADITSGGALTFGDMSYFSFDGVNIIIHRITGGNIVPPVVPTCTIIGTDINKTVTLPKVKSSDFNGSPSAGDMPFTLTAGNCQNASLATFTFSGTADAANPVLFKNTGSATGVGVRIYPGSDSSQTIGANGTNNVQTAQVTGGQGGQAVLSLGAQYYKTAATVGAGQVTAIATVTMSYN
ncbi:Pilin (type 1 fimbria component protein) [Dyella sp. OK004]|uniref:fimbrial protein n=1 Tax=Dyella sp. OK004 TaxID=1855292 RepID=UPI0008E82A34|nr:fimbrial protein [Dyella sp. OK004]SFR95162.1 Pilin (type 1 fimbria component protein) [Dyella sp. OK004]